MFWVNFLHIYQPSVQKPEIVKKIADESYDKIFSGLLSLGEARLSMNISGGLCELLDKNGRNDILENINKLLESGRLEIAGSAKHHAFLPLLPESEIERQIILNEEALNKYFGKNWKKGGFFPPEMAYSKKTAEIAKNLGYKWIIMDEIGFPEGKEIKKNIVYEIAGLKDFGVFFRNRRLSFKIMSVSQKNFLPDFLRFVGKNFKKNDYAVAAMDGEMFGHHRPGLEKCFFDLFRQNEIKAIAASDVLEIFKNKEIVEPRPSTWATMQKDFKADQPYFRWKNKDNQIQQWQWQLLNLAIGIANKDDNQKSREALDKALLSDQFWWSSARPWWSLEWIERGAHDLKEIVKNSVVAKKEKEKAEELYKKIVYTGFEWQRTGLVDEMSLKENEEIRNQKDEGKGEMPDKKSGDLMF